MRFSVVVYPLDRWSSMEALLDAMKVADRLGISSVGLSEHIVNPLGPGPARSATLPSNIWLDSVVLGTAVAAVTRRLRVLLSALIVPYRDPVLMAKALASLDVISGGRLTVTAGSGWLEPEFEILGVPYDQRGPRADDHLEAMIALWTQDEPAYDGRFTRFRDITFEPKCVQRPHVPVMIGGSGPLVLRRVLRLGAGWAPMRGSADELRPHVEWLRDNAAVYGRDPSTIKVFTRVDVLGGDRTITASRAHVRPEPVPAAASGDRQLEAAAATTIELVGTYAALGFDELGVSFPWSSPAEYCERLEWLAQAVAPYTA